jgi:hypothetical protein
MPNVTGVSKSFQRPSARLRQQQHPAHCAFGGRKFLASRCGASAAEFALVFPVFMLCLFGITAFASTLFIENNMVNAARESVRQMAVHHDTPFNPSGVVQCDAAAPPVDDEKESAEYIACSYLTIWGTDFTVDASWDCPAEDKATVEITLDASQAAVMDVFGFFNGKELTAKVTMRKEDACGT